MLLRDLIREYTQSRAELPPAPPARPVPQTHVCPKCKMESGRTAVEQGAMICPACGAYFRMNARERITHTFDAGSFQELDADVTSVDFLSFPGYAEKLEKARKTTGENEAVLCGTAAIGGMFCATFVMDSSFIMASMGSAVGEKITRLFEFALAQRLPSSASRPLAARGCRRASCPSCRWPSAPARSSATARRDFCTSPC